MQGLKKDKLKLQRIVEKSKRQSAEIRELQNQVYWLKSSRLNWKAKSKGYLAELRQLEKGLKNTREQTIDKVARHSYDSKSISLILQLRRRGNMSLRSVVSVLKLLVVVLGLELRIPSHESISLWEQRIGLYGISKQSYGEDAYAVIIDESITIGKEKILLILGVKV